MVKRTDGVPPPPFPPAPPNPHRCRVPVSTAQPAPAAVAGPVVRRIERTYFPNSPAHRALSAFCGAMYDQGIDGADMRASMLWSLGLEECEEPTAAPTTKPAPQQEPTVIDPATMELAEIVGLIGPASRTHDLHAAIQRFHDLICANATLKAAQMAAGAISEAAPQQAAQEPSPTAGMSIAQRILHVGGRNNAAGYVEFGSTQAVEALVKHVLRDLQPSPAAEGDALDAARLGWLNHSDMAALERVNECFEDGEGYDVPASKMKRMAELGVVQSLGFGRYGITSFGRIILGSRHLRKPLETAEECNSRLGREHQAPEGK